MAAVETKIRLQSRGYGDNDVIACVLAFARTCGVCGDHVSEKSGSVFPSIQSLVSDVVSFVFLIHAVRQAVSIQT